MCPQFSIIIISCWFVFLTDKVLDPFAWRLWYLRDVFGVYAVDGVSHILPGRGELIATHWQQVCCCWCVNIYAPWCTNSQLMFHQVTSWHHCLIARISLARAVLLIKFEKPGCDQKGEWEAGKHSEGVVQPKQKRFQQSLSFSLSSSWRFTWILKSQFGHGTASPGPSSLCEQNDLR